ncbi:hypothetical protein BDV11DRAFT_171275 [Aspergillus similis]
MATYTLNRNISARQQTMAVVLSMARRPLWKYACIKSRTMSRLSRDASSLYAPTHGFGEAVGEQLLPGLRRRLGRGAGDGLDSLASDTLCSPMSNKDPAAYCGLVHLARPTVGQEPPQASSSSTPGIISPKAHRIPLGSDSYNVSAEGLEV